MAVRPLGDGRYAVDSESGATYVVDLDTGRCTCPDHEIRGERCKHVRRVAIEVTAGRVPAPDEQRVDCAACGAPILVRGAADASRDRPPHLCDDCALDPGDLAIDRETGERLLIVAVTDRRAADVEVPDAGHTVADHPTNRGYDPADPVVYAVYPASVRDEPPRRYAFPISRLDRVDGT